MQIINRKSVNLILIATLLLSLFLPHTARAYEVEGSADDPSLTIYKYEQEPGTAEGEAGTGGEQVVPDENIPLSGVEFTLTQTHQYNADTDTWDEVIDGDVLVETTDENGQIVFNTGNGLELGRYTVQETAGPAHVNLNEEIFSVDIPMTNPDGTVLNYDVVIYPKNETIRGAVELLKLDGEQDGEVGLAGAVFDLYEMNEDGEYVILTEGLTTDSNGYIRVDGLAFGDYYFIETEAPGDYVLFGNEQYFSITESGTITVDGQTTGTVETIEITNYIAPAIEKTINGSTETHETNRETEFTYNLIIALPEDIADYQEFIITDILDDRLSYTGTWTVEGIDTSLLDFTEAGQTLTWLINDFSPLDGVEFFTINFTAEINEGVEIDLIPNTGGIEFTNESGTDGDKETPPVYVTPTEGSLTIIKQDGETSEVLAGAEFELRDSEGEVVREGTTGSDGVISWTGIDYGEYTLHEVKAPEGYRILQNPINITIDNENSENTLTVDNSQTGWELPTTGGIGTTLFTIVGLSLMGLALYLYVRRRNQTA